MAKKYKESRTLCGSVFVMVFIALLSADSNAVTHVVQFGGTLGFTYSPSSFNAKVGDTVEWEGDFTMHPLTSTTIPTGAASWQNTTGTAFKYVIEVPGSYDYHCEIHYTVGMAGSFTVSATGAMPNAIPIKDNLSLQVMSNVNETVIQLRGLQTEVIAVDVYTILGKRSGTLVEKPLAPGLYRIAVPKMPRGIYVLQVHGGGMELTRTFTVKN